MKSTAIYLVHNTWSVSNYKVGISSTPSRRLGEITVNYEVDPRIIATAWFTEVKAAQTAETFWHRYLREYSIDDHGGDEWFSLPTSIRDSIISWTKNSKQQNEITSWMYRATRNNRNGYNSSLINTIPRHYRPPSIDIWINPKMNLVHSLMPN